MEITTGLTPSPWLATIYGVPGIGKSTIAKHAPNPLFIDAEGGLKRIDCHKLPMPKSFDDMIEQLRFAYGNQDYQTIVIDTLLAVSTLIEQAVLNEADNPKNGLKDSKKFPYDMAKVLLCSKWHLFIKILKQIIDESGKNVLCIGHDRIETVTNPSGDNFQRHSINMYKNAVDFFVADMDAVLFAHYEKVFTKKAGTEQKVVAATGNRLLTTEEKLFCVGKNRMNLPSEIPFNNKPEIEKFFEYLNK